MAIWNREYSDKRTYFNIDGGLIKKQDSQLTIRILGIMVLKRKMIFEADDAEKKEDIGFNNK